MTDEEMRVFVHDLAMVVAGPDTPECQRLSVPGTDPRPFMGGLLLAVSVLPIIISEIGDSGLDEATLIAAVERAKAKHAAYVGAGVEIRA